MKVHDTDPNRHTIDPMLRIRQVSAMTSLSTSTIYREIAAGRFPPSVRLTTNTVAWRSSDLQAWLSERCREIHNG